MLSFLSTILQTKLFMLAMRDVVYRRSNIVFLKVSSNNRKMESVIKTIDRDIKNITIIVFLGFVIITIYISFFSYAISPNNEQTFINHFSVDVNLKCNSDKFFFSEYSNIKCYIAAKSVDGYNYKNVQISIAAVDDRFNKSFWSCDAFFQNVTISNYAYYKLCKHPTDEYISTKSPTLIKFKLISLVAENSTQSFASIKFDGDIDSFFSPELRILPNEIEASAIATNTNSRLSYVALFGVIISVVFAGIIPFLVQRRQIEYDDKLHIKDQYKILSTLKNDLEKIELNIIGLEETIKSSIPLWLVHKPDISYFRQNLDTKINNINT